MEMKKTANCKRCKSEVRRGIRICPYCGVLNPTLTASTVIIWTTIIFLLMMSFTYFNR